MNLTFGNKYPTMNKVVPISVIIPVYGVNSNLRRALNSLWMQTILPLEVIVVSDGNNEECNLQLREEVARFKMHNIELFELSSNVGAGAARNFGWDRANGEFIAFLDSDDAWHPCKLEQQYAFMVKNRSVDCCGHKHKFVEFDKLDWACFSSEAGCKFYNFRQILLLNPFITPSVMLKTNLPFRFSSSQRYSEDYRLWLELSAGGLIIARMNMELAAIFKPSISTHGLSSHLIAMEIGEIRAYWAACKHKAVGVFLMVILIPYSILKFCRRLIVFVYQKVGNLLWKS